ncbi:hypothetical protein TeGR_g10079 [Tetraparma gracilis]|uniref:aminodeoxychorismate synthase n=1 Tax=Tetraparma gracilis TaxID=2962635 RepID=A0ABQ6MBC0_9STRA|nr:hypothetical protein TeGR_g10079 [Tetraparma gracilis]
MPRILILDNADSYTANLLIYLSSCSVPTVLPASAPLPPDLLSSFEGVIISPGPGTVTDPSDAGSAAELFRFYSDPSAPSYASLPILGVCLGHQMLGYHGFSPSPLPPCASAIVPSPEPMHGRITNITLGDAALSSPIFRGLPPSFPCTRYHSLSVSSLPASSPLVPLAFSPCSSGTPSLQALQHGEYPHYGVQFHPESIGSQPHGGQILRNFAKVCADAMSASAEAMSASAPLFSHLSASPLLFFLDSSSASPPSFSASSPQDPQDPQPNARWSIIGVAASVATSRVGDPDIRHTSPSSPPRSTPETSALEYIRSRTQPRPVVRHGPGAAADLPFYGGLVGSLSYSLRAQCADAPSQPPPAGAVECELLEAEDFFVEDCWTGEVRAVSRTAEGMAELEKTAYTAAVRSARSSIRLGNTYEVCLTNARRLLPPSPPDAARIYSKLRARNPAPYAAFLRTPEGAVCCSSPERFLKVEDGEVESKPIKGTIKRDPDPLIDARNKETLRGSVKDNAENLMIVDLVRNDFSRCCEPESVTVAKLCDIESYATVHQMVSTVRGKLSPSASVADVLHSSFPGGSMTGAPKKRTMEIISELEGEERGVYSGSIGYLGVDGRASLNIVIRTAVVDEKGDGGVSVGCGGAITWLSDEGAEYDEMRLKGRVVEQTVLDALGLANSGEGEGGASGGGAGRGGWYAAPQKSRPATVQVAAKANDIDETP